MLDINFIRNNVDDVKSMLKKREINYPLEKLLKLDNEKRKLMTQTQNLRAIRNSQSNKLAIVKNNISEKHVLEIREIKNQIKLNDNSLQTIETEIYELLNKMPNMIHESVPDGKDDTSNIEIKHWGTPPKFDFPEKDHIAISKKLDIIDLEKAADVSGSRFYYLKGDLVKLNYALMVFAIDFMGKKGFTPIQPPYMLRKKPLEGAVYLSDFEDTIYKVDDDLYLIATSEHPLAALHSNEILEGKNLPLKYVGISPCFRKEAGTHGRDTKGIFRTHQFNKIEQFVFSKPEESWNIHNSLLNNAEELLQKLCIPYKVVNVCIGDLGMVAAKKFDIEVWLPGQKKYRELVSCSNCTDYQSRRLKIRFRDKSNEKTQLVHTLNSTALATERTLIAIIENYQQKDGSINIPDILQQYMNDKKSINQNF